jgi:hypothetical protein
MSKKGFALKVLVGLGFTIALAQSSQAQTAPGADFLRNPDSQDSLTNLFNNRGDGSATGIMELIQRVGQANTDPDLLRQQQRENIDSATADFLTRRRQALQGRPKPAQTAPAAPVVPATPK